MAANPQISDQHQISDGVELSLPQGVSLVDGDVTPLVVEANSRLSHILPAMNSTGYGLYLKIDDVWRANQVADEINDPNNRYSIVDSEIGLAANLNAQGIFAPLVNPATALGHSLGVWGGAGAEAGFVASGAGGQFQASHVTFPDGSRQVYITHGGFIGGPGYGVTSPSTFSQFNRTEGGVALGSSGALSGGFLFSNATNPDQLHGLSENYNLNIGVFTGTLSFSGKEIYTLSFGVGKGRSPSALPFSESHYKTYAQYPNEIVK